MSKQSQPINLMVEINFIVFDRLMQNKREYVNWEEIRSLCSDDETADKICKFIYQEVGLKIHYRGNEVNYE
jgi:hypothetical protein